MTALHLGAFNALAATLLALVALAVSLCCPRRPVLRHALWLLVVLKLVLPPLVRLPIPRAAEVEEPCCARPGEVAFAAEAPLPVEPTPTARPVPWPEIALGVWAGGAMLFWGVTASRLGRFLALVRSLPEGDAAEVRRVAGRMGLSRAPDVRMAPGTVTPLVFGVGRGVVVLPSALWATLDAGRREALLAHELAHLVRRDGLFGLLGAFVLGLYWWLPTAWLACRAMRDASEECCDALVVAAFPERACDYASVLVDTVAFLSGKGAALPAGAGGAAPVRKLKRRLSMILNPSDRRSPRLAWVAASGLLVMSVLPTFGDAPKVDAEPGDVRAIIAREASCRACHVAAREKPGAIGALHDRIAKMIAEQAEMEKKMKASREELQKALKAFAEQQAAPKKAEKDKRIDELEGRLKRLQEELKALRGKPAAGAATYLNTRNVAFEGDQGETVGYAVTHEGKLLTLVEVKPGQRKRRFTAPADGVYVVRPVARPEEPGLRLVVDTVPPVALSFAYKATTMPAIYDLSWEVRDTNIGFHPVRMDWAAGQGGPWHLIAESQPPTGTLAWRRPANAPEEVYLRLTARDLAGNSTTVTTPEAVRFGRFDP